MSDGLFHGVNDPVGAEHEEPDTCDRCGAQGKVSVGYESIFGYDGLCDGCLDTLYASRGRNP